MASAQRRRHSESEAHVHAVIAENLTKRYGTTTALDGFELRVPPGRVYALLGPNGAGKTTAVRVLSTLLRFDTGCAEVAGYDVTRQPNEVRRRIGLLGQHVAVDEVLSGRQNLEMFARLHHLPAARARVRAAELLERFGLAEAADRPARTYSGGMRRRLDLAASLVLTPPVLFLDEPTTGLDPRGRTEVWTAVRALVATGSAVLLTTQYLDEADQLADEVCVVDSGRVIARGSPERLKSMLGADRLEVVVDRADRLTDTQAILARYAAGPVHVDPDRRHLAAPVRDRVAALTGVARDLRDAGIDAEDVALRRPTLDEVFLHLTSTRSDGGAA
jgi:ABC-2 type transport system ATP-binding protein